MNLIFTLAISVLTLGLAVTFGAYADRFRSMPRFQWPCLAGAVWFGAVSIYCAYLAGGMAQP